MMVLEAENGCLQTTIDGVMLAKLISQAIQEITDLEITAAKIYNNGAVWIWRLGDKMQLVIVSGGTAARWSKVVIRVMQQKEMYYFN